ncbi:oxidoreductase [Streptomyces sp. NPDC092307]|uniref:oxidoreductase n=1 Tax=Streptomyces sp. NPDC092307 TaxID=3366013 RepID=UPI00381D36C3
MPLKPLGLGEIVSSSFATLGRYWKQLAGVMLAVLGLCLLAMSLLAGITVAAVYDHLEPVFDPPYGQEPTAEHLTPVIVAAVTLFVLLFAVGLLGMAVLAALCPAILQEAVVGRPTTFRAMWRAALRRTPSVLGALLLTGLIAGAPVLAALAVWIPVLVVSVSAEEPSPGAVLLLPLLLLPAIPVSVWLGTRLSLAPAVAVMEKAGSVAALRRSAALVKGAWWRIFGITLIGSMIAMSVAYLIQMPFQLVGTFGMIPLMAEGGEGGDPSTGMIVALVIGFACIMIGSGVSQMFQIGYTQLFSGLLYVDQRIRRENLAQALLAELAAQAPGAAPGPVPGPVPADADANAPTLTPTLTDADAPTVAQPDRPQPRTAPEPETLPNTLPNEPTDKPTDRPTDD